MNTSPGWSWPGGSTTASRSRCCRGSGASWRALSGVRETRPCRVGRGNGKSALCAAVAAAVVDPSGPLTGRRREAVVCAASFGQARIIFEDVLSFLGALYDLSDRARWRKQDSQNAATLEFRPTGSRVKCIGSDPANAHGLRPALALLDEPAQWESSKADRMLAAMRTSLGKVTGSKLIALGTRPADEGHFFARLLASAPYSQVHAARGGDPPFQRRTWRRANPSLDHLPALEAQIKSEAEAAKRDPALLPSFEALRLNLGTADVEVQVLVDARTWANIEGEASMIGPSVWGVDLGTSAAQSAIAAYWPETGCLVSLAAFPETPTLDDRGLRDGVGGLYRECARRGELVTLGKRSTDIPALLALALARFGRPARVVADRWREAELRDALEKAGVPMASFEARGQGFQDGGEDVRSFTRACVEGKVTAAPSLLLRSAMGEARTVSDPAGNRKLAKASQGGRRMRARDDAAAAAILAVAAGVRQPVKSTRRWRYRGAAA